MKLWAHALLNGYYYGSLPWRAHRNAQEAAAGRAPLLVLFYHRVADDAATPWTTTPREFERHMQWLGKRFEFISLADVQQRVRSGFNDRPSVSITFDDGYSDNCRFALPYLIKARIPVTYFVCSQNILRGVPFSHDQALGMRFNPNTVEQLQALAASGVEVGAHSRTHADFGKLQDPAKLHDELITSSEELQQALRRNVRYFAFPFGRHANLQPAAFHLAYECGFEAVCSAYGGYNFPGDDAFHIQRISGDDAFIRIKNWCTLDPRKRRTRRFYYGVGMTPVAPSGARRT